MGDYNPTNKIVYVDHANIDKDGAFKIHINIRAIQIC